MIHDCERDRVQTEVKAKVSNSYISRLFVMSVALSGR